MNNRITELFQIEKPIIQAGMIWTSGWKLAAAVSNAGGLGMLGAGSMYPAVLEEHLQKMQAATHKPFAVNLPLLYPSIAEHLHLVEKYRVPIVFTSAGNPATLAPRLRAAGITVVHVVSSSRFAIKARDAGCSAVVAEGFEAGGHNGREETTTMALIPQVVAAVDIPVIAAGGIATGAQMAAAFALGAEAVQVGSRFVASPEASSHEAYKNAIVASGEGDTKLMLKSLTPVRLLRNAFMEQVAEAESRCASREELAALLGRGRAKKGMFEGDLAEGELEIGQVSALITSIKPAAEIVEELWTDFRACCKRLGNMV